MTKKSKELDGKLKVKKRVLRQLDDETVLDKVRGGAPTTDGYTGSVRFTTQHNQQLRRR